MEALGDGLKVMVKIFRRECPRVSHSERTTVQGAAGMLMVLQLAVAEVNKQVTVHPFLFKLPQIQFKILHPSLKEHFVANTNAHQQFIHAHKYNTKVKM